MQFSLKNMQVGFESLMPAIALTASSFWIAWIELIYSGEIYLGQTAPSQTDIILSYIASTTAMALMLIVYGFKHVPMQRILQKPAWVVGAGAGAALATWLDMLTGSYVFIALTGVFTSLLAARFSFIMAQVKPKEIALTCCIAQIVASLIYGYVLSLPQAWQPLFMCLLPLLGGACSMLDGGRLRYDSVEAAKSSPQGKRALVRLVVAIGVFSVAINVVRGFWPSMIEMSTFAEARGTSSVLFFFVKVAMCVVVAGMPLKTNLSRFCYYGFLILAFCTLPLPLFGLGSSSTLETFGCINAMLNILVWTLLCSMAFKSGASPVRLFGWGWGTMSLCSVAGWLLGMGMYVAGMSSANLLPVEVVLLALMLVSGIVVLNAQVVDRLFLPIDGGDDQPVQVSLDETRELNRALESQLVSESEPVGAEAGSNEDEGQAHKGRWKRAVAAMAVDRGLSNREQDVLELLLKGYTKSRTAEELCISYNTARSHVRNIYTKCDAHSQQDLIDAFEAYRNAR